MGSKVINFDLFMTEHEKRKMDVVIYGKTYTVPMEIPAIVPIMMARAEDSMNNGDRGRMIMRAADAMLGKAAVDEICKKGMSSTDLAALVERLFAAINGSDDEEEESEEYTDEDSRVKVGRNTKK